MKKSFILLSIAAIAALASCNKPASNGEPVLPSAERISINVGVRGLGQTKATGVVSNSTDSEAKVNNLQIFVFNGNDRDGYASVNNALSATVECSAGSRDIYAIVNAQNLSAVTSKSALLASVAVLDDEIANFIMEGHTTQTLKIDAGVTIDVNRLASRIVLKGIKNDLNNEAQANAFHLDAVYLVNVAGDVDFGQASTYAVSSWYNKMGYESANNLGNFTYDAIDSDLANDATYSTAHYLYAMPNANDAAVGGTWSARRSILVVHATVAGAGMAYPIVLPVLQSNKSYEINLLTLTRPGNPDSDPDCEEKPIVGIDQNFTINVVDWTTVLVNGEGESDGNYTI